MLGINICWRVYRETRIFGSYYVGFGALEPELSGLEADTQVDIKLHKLAPWHLVGALPLPPH